jgi:molybdopterin/thiamine biosynthesis adenylyltransferase
MMSGPPENDLTAYLLQNKEAGDPPRVDEAVLASAAGRFGVSARRVQLACLAAKLTPARYARSIPAFGIEGQVRLLESSVGIVGAGGLGGFLLEILARAGVGRLVVADKDVFEPTNLNRQLLAAGPTLGRPKAEVAAERIGLINPAVTVEAAVEAVTAASAPKIFRGVMVMADALDNVPDRLMIEAFARKTGIPFVFGAVAGFMGQVTTVFPEDPGLGRIYGSGEKPAAGADPDLGIAPMTPPLVAARQAGEIINILLGRTQGLLRGRLWVVDMGSGRGIEVNLG